VKPIGELSRAELGALVCTTLELAGIKVVLTGGSCVSVWTHDAFASLDLDFIALGLHTNREIRAALKSIGFKSRGRNSRYFEHVDCDLVLEFPAGPLQVGDEHVPDINIDSLETETGTLRLLRPTDCVKDRLAGYYHWGDEQNLLQALEVARRHPVDWTSLEKWHRGEGQTEGFEDFRRQVEGWP
jgi:hypothetical protein